MGLGMYVPHVCIAPRKAVRHQLPYEAGEGGQQGGAGGGGEETLQICFYMDPTQKEEHLRGAQLGDQEQGRLEEVARRGPSSNRVYAPRGTSTDRERAGPRPNK